MTYVAGSSYYSVNDVYINLKKDYIAYIVKKVGDKYHILGIKKPYININELNTINFNYIKDIAINNNLLNTHEILCLEKFTYKTINLCFCFEILSKWFPEIISIVDRDSIKIDNFNTFTCYLKYEDVEKIKYIINNCSYILNKFNFNELLYGRILISKNLIGRPRACYNLTSDIVRFAEKIVYSKNYRKHSIKSMLHELGHRAYFMGFVDKEKCKIFYKEIISSKNKQYIPSNYCYKNVKEWFAEIFSYGLLYDNSKFKDIIRKMR